MWSSRISTGLRLANGYAAIQVDLDLDFEGPADRDAAVTWLTGHIGSEFTYAQLRAGRRTRTVLVERATRKFIAAASDPDPF